jgi:acetyltransferase-like isoleucine patch superfamily enzyme
LGGELTSLISPKAHIGSFGVEIASVATIIIGTQIKNEVKISKGLLMYPSAIITRDCIIGDFIELSSRASILGNCIVNSRSHIGANATILSGVCVSEGCSVGAGAVVTKDVEANKTVKGIPAK